MTPATKEEPVPSTKPHNVGLYTSTASFAGRSMWSLYLEFNRESTLFTHPWHTWRLEVSQAPTVVEIVSGSDWATFVGAYPYRVGSVLYPDWAVVARHYDGVHMTLLAIAATQGLFFGSEQGFIAPPYWDVESTLWLTWQFASAKLLMTST